MQQSETYSQCKYMNEDRQWNFRLSCQPGDDSYPCNVPRVEKANDSCCKAYVSSGNFDNYQYIETCLQNEYYKN